MSISYSQQRKLIQVASLVLQSGVGLWACGRMARTPKNHPHPVMRSLGLFAAANIGSLALSSVGVMAKRLVTRKELKELRDYRNTCDTLICSLSDCERELSYSDTPLSGERAVLFNWCRATIEELLRHRDSIANAGRVKNIYRAVIERGIPLYNPKVG